MKPMDVNSFLNLFSGFKEDTTVSFGIQQVKDKVILNIFIRETDQQTGIRHIKDIVEINIDEVLYEKSGLLDERNKIYEKYYKLIKQIRKINNIIQDE